MEQQELFSKEVVMAERDPEIPGFRLQRDYITAAEERQLITCIDAEEWGNEYRRRTQHYGLGYGSGTSKSPAWLRDFPRWLLPLAERVSTEAFGRPAENCVINEYVPPQGIAPHRDYDAFGPVVACVSLGSDIVMDFISPDRKVRLAVHVPVRSYWVISGDARSKWLHGIAPRLADTIGGERRSRGRRISITFRTAKVHKLGKLS